MVFKFMTFDVDDEFLNNHPGSPPYYGPCLSSSSADSSPAVSICNGCLAGDSVSGLPDVAEPSSTGQNRDREIGVATILSSVPPGLLRHNAGYHAPELTDNREVSQASDVYSLGVILLEILTGKEPIHSTSGNNVIQLVRWVQSVVREEWTSEVFDVQLWRYPNMEEEMVDMLKIGMGCVACVPEQRPTALEVLNVVENIRRNHNMDNSFSEIKSGGTPAALTPPPPSEVAFSFALDSSSSAFISL